MFRNTLLMILVLVVWTSFVMADDGVVSAQLQEKLSQVTNHQEKIPVVVHCKGMPSYARVAAEYRFLGATEVIHDQVIRVMKDDAERQHHWLKQMCQSRSLSGQVEGFASIWITNSIALKATPAAIQEIAGQPDVEKITLNEPVPMLVAREITYGLQKINAPSAWKYYTGKGSVVAVIDTGVNVHPDLKNRVMDGKNYIDSSKPPRDDHSHGTHCAGTVAGNGANGSKTGVAPEATILAIKVLGEDGSGDWANLWMAIEETISRKAKVISMSLGGEADETTRERLRTACQNAIAAGVIPIIAAGNEGPFENTVASPGDVPEVITVGATDQSDEIAFFSSCGPVSWEGNTVIKPDVSAPGVDVKSCRHDSNGYTSMSGTSMATPHVAGVVALMVQAKAGITCEQAKQILEATAVDKGKKGKDNTYGSGRVDALRSVKSAEALSTNEFNGRWETVVKELEFNITIDANGNIDSTHTVNNDVIPGTVTIWVDVKETHGRKGKYDINFTLTGPNGTKTGRVIVDYDNIPTNPNKYDAKYGFNVGNFELVNGDYTGRITSAAPNSSVKSLNITLAGKATWPARPENK